MAETTQPTCELDQWALQEIVRRRRSGEPVSAVASGIGAHDQALRMAEAGARSLELSDLPPHGHVNIVQLPADTPIDGQVPLPLEPFDLMLCQRTLSSLRYEEARRVLHRASLRLKIGGKLFISLYGIHSELGEDYADGEKLVNQRYCPVAPRLAERYNLLHGPVCLYSERNLFSLIMEAGLAVIKTSTSALGHVRGIAARI
jgi:hypothetical protein